MKLLIHDYAGHPFQASLSRELARRGHSVLHAFFEGDRGPKGDFRLGPADAGDLRFLPLRLNAPYLKSSFVSRRFGDVAYGKILAELISTEKPDLVLSGNTPTEAQSFAARSCRENNASFVYWVQDFYSIAVSLILRRKLGVFGQMVGAYYRYLERRQMVSADAIVTITAEFEDLAARWGGDADKVTTIENWGLVDDIIPVLKCNSWSCQMGLALSFNFVYSGTLGLKHNPMLLVELARATRGKARVVVVSEGVGLELLRHVKSVEGLDNLIILPLQPFDVFKEVLGTADVAIAIIEAEAGRFSVPSKVQSYLCAERAVLLAAPRDNLAARVIRRESAGIPVEANDVSGFLAAAEQMFENPGARLRFAQNGRAYAESNFDIAVVTDRFEAVFKRALQRRPTL